MLYLIRDILGMCLLFSLLNKFIGQVLFMNNNQSSD